MSATHSFIWTCIAVLAAYSCFVTIYVRQLRSYGSAMESRIASLKAWADSYVAFHADASKQQSTRFEDLNFRLIQIETENKPTAPVKNNEDDDPFSGARSWTSQAAAASRGAGVEYLA